jgi:NAD-dependent SIR2 family protein deacetylase
VNRASITKSHEFIKTLEDKGKLLRCYTQNIDGLEPRLGMCAELDNAETPPRGKGKERAPEKEDVRVVQLHGDLDRVVCTLCRAMFDFNESHRATFHGGEPPACPACLDNEAARLAAGKRKLGVGTLRPNIVLYNEHHSKGETVFNRSFCIVLIIFILASGDLIAKLVSGDIKKKPDLLIVMGTSLKVVGIKRVVKDMAKVIHTNSKGRVVLINQTQMTKEWESVFDYHVQGPADDIVEHLWNDLDRREGIEKKKAEKTENKLPNTQGTSLQRLGMDDPPILTRCACLSGTTPRVSTLFKATKSSASKVVAKSPKSMPTLHSTSPRSPLLAQQPTPPSRSSRPLDIGNNSKRVLSPPAVAIVPAEQAQPEPEGGSPTKRRRTFSGGNLTLPLDDISVVAQASVLESSGFIAIAAPKPAVIGRSAVPGRSAPAVASATRVVKTKADQVVVNALFKSTKNSSRIAEKKVALSGVVPVVSSRRAVVASR